MFWNKKPYLLSFFFRDRRWRNESLILTAKIQIPVKFLLRLLWAQSNRIPWTWSLTWPEKILLCSLWTMFQSTIKNHKSLQIKCSANGNRNQFIIDVKRKRPAEVCASEFQRKTDLSYYIGWDCWNVDSPPKNICCLCKEWCNYV